MVKPHNNIFLLLLFLFLLFCTLTAQATEAHFDELYKLLNELNATATKHHVDSGRKKKSVVKKKISKTTRRVHPSKSGEIDLHLLIKRTANEYGIPASLLALIIDIESACDPCAVSKAGATGLCQLMPATWKALGVKDPFDPVQNVRAGAKLLRQLLDSTDGRLLECATSYNAGPKTLGKKWESFPRETKKYLSLVVSKYPSYIKGRWKKHLPKYIPYTSKNLCSMK